MVLVGRVVHCPNGWLRFVLASKLNVPPNWHSAENWRLVLDDMLFVKIGGSRGAICPGNDETSLVNPSPSWP